VAVRIVPPLVHYRRAMKFCVLAIFANYETSGNCIFCRM